jgi:hypothetical protein
MKIKSYLSYVISNSANWFIIPICLGLLSISIIERDSFYYEAGFYTAVGFFIFVLIINGIADYFSWKTLNEGK